MLVQAGIIPFLFRQESWGHGRPVSHSFARDKQKKSPGSMIFAGLQGWKDRRKS